MVEEQVPSDFDRARQKALVNDLLSVFSRRPDDLISFHEFAMVQARQESYRGMQEVPIRQIIGSFDRFRDFDRAFLPRHARSAGRWKNVDRAYHQEIRLPPVQLYKVGDIYFVKDGNHRVSVAREHGVEFIDAEVIESHVRVPIEASMSPFQLLQVEYAEFLRLTNLDRLRPEHDIRPSALGRYDEIWEHIVVRQLELTDTQGLKSRSGSRAELVRRHLPADRPDCPRTRGAYRFPNRTEADIYLWVMAHRNDLIEHEEHEIAPVDAIQDLATRSRNQSPGSVWAGFAGSWRRWIARAGGPSLTGYSRLRSQCRGHTEPDSRDRFRFVAHGRHRKFAIDVVKRTRST